MGRPWPGRAGEAVGRAGSRRPSQPPRVSLCVPVTFTCYMLPCCAAGSEAGRGPGERPLGHTCGSLRFR